MGCETDDGDVKGQDTLDADTVDDAEEDQDAAEDLVTDVDDEDVGEDGNEDADEDGDTDMTTTAEVYGDCAAEADVRGMIDNAIGDTISSYSVVQIDRDAFDAAAEEGELALPTALEGGELVENRLPAVQFDSIYTAEASTQTRDDNGLVETVSAPQLEGWQLGCDETGACGSFTFLDPDPASDAGWRYEGMIIDDTSGWTVIESAESLLLNATGEYPLDLPRGCGIVYNAVDVGGAQLLDYGINDFIPIDDVLPVTAEIPIVLDSDAAHHTMDPNTVWQRQASLLFGVNLIYGLIEPLSTNNFDIRFSIKNQEAWAPGSGPTTLDGAERLDEINAEDYQMVVDVQNDEVSYHFIGSDIEGGIAGWAGGICNLEGYDDTFASDVPNPENHAWGQQVDDIDGGYAFSTLLGRTIVMTHEIGHMLGAIHGEGESSVCAGGTYQNLCGTSLMLSGASGGVAPDNRQPFFSDDNSNRIANCVDEEY